MTSTIPSLHLFDAVGIELEYMIVDCHSLDVRPISEVLLQDEKGIPVSDIERGSLAWSNELTQHVIELKTNGPRKNLTGLAAEFQSEIQEVNRRLDEQHACLLPGGMHPWMNPENELKLWPYDYSSVYQAFHRVFDCSGHGWANLQSMHINLPFCGDDEFGRLHAAIRLVLPLLPAVAASSPYVEGKSQGYLDSRLYAYATNSRRIPTVTGSVIPEQVFTQDEYEDVIFQPMYREIAPHDPEGILQDEFLNARGAIARFDRGTIEIRVIDVQECPLADIAIAALTIEVIRNLVEEQDAPYELQKRLTVEQLRTHFDHSIREGELAVIQDAEYLAALGFDVDQMPLQDIWKKLYEKNCEVLQARTPELIPALELILHQGPLARRLSNVIGATPHKTELHNEYRQLANCLTTGRLYDATPHTPSS